MQVLPDRRGSRPTLHCQELEEPRHRLTKRVVLMPTADALESGNDKPQHLLDRSAHFFGHLLRCSAVLAMASVATNTLGHVSVDMSWQIGDIGGSPLARERSESDRTRHPPPDRANIMAVVGHPADVLLDLGADP
jgi:hypothetical protein